MLDDHPYGKSIVGIHEEGICLILPESRDVDCLERFKVGIEVGVTLDGTVVHHVKVYPVQLTHVHVTAHNLHTVSEKEWGPYTASSEPYIPQSLSPHIAHIHTYDGAVSCRETSLSTLDTFVSVWDNPKCPE